MMNSRFDRLSIEYFWNTKWILSFQQALKNLLWNRQYSRSNCKVLAGLLICDNRKVITEILSWDFLSHQMEFNYFLNILAQKSIPIDCTNFERSVSHHCLRCIKIIYFFTEFLLFLSTIILAAKWILWFLPVLSYFLTLFFINFNNSA